MSWMTWILIVAGYACLLGLGYQAGRQKGWEKGHSDGYMLGKKHGHEAGLLEARRAALARVASSEETVKRPGESGEG